MGLIEDCVSEAVEREREVARVLENMIQAGEWISFANVAHRAGVSRAYVYRHEKIAARIRAVRVPDMTKDELRKELMRERAKNHDNNQ